MGAAASMVLPPLLPPKTTRNSVAGTPAATAGSSPTGAISYGISGSGRARWGSCAAHSAMRASRAVRPATLTRRRGYVGRRGVVIHIDVRRCGDRRIFRIPLKATFRLGRSHTDAISHRHSNRISRCRYRHFDILQAQEKLMQPVQH